MFRAIPAPNRYLHDKWHSQDLRLHKKKVNNVKPVLDMSAPIATRYPIIRAKQEQMQEDRFTEIERENRILLARMTQIMDHDSTIYNSKSSLASIKKLNVGHSKRSSSTQSKKSLNGDQRKRELNRIVDENHKFLERLKNKRSAYNVEQCRQDRIHKESILKNICRYPHIFRDRDKSVPRKRVPPLLQFPDILKSIKEKSPDRTLLDEEDESLEAVQSQRVIAPSRTTKQGSPMLIRGHEELDSQRVVLYKKRTRMSGKKVLVEISRNKTRMFIVVID